MLLNLAQPLVSVGRLHKFFKVYLYLRTYPVTAELDYMPTTVALILPAQSPNGTSRCVIVTIVDDDELEERESFFVSLNNLTPDEITVQEGENMLTVLILDDDCKYS